MSTGRLHTTTPVAANQLYPSYVVPTGNYAVFNVSITNTTSSAVTIRLALSMNGLTPQSSEYIEYGAVVAPNGVFERTGLVGGAGCQVMYYASATGINVNVWGIETSTS